MNWSKSVSCETACLLSETMLSGEWCSSLMMVDPYTRIRCSRSSRVSSRVSEPCNLMKQAQRVAALRARDRVVIKLHRIDGAAAKFVVLRVRSEDRTQQNAGLRSLGVFRETGARTAMRAGCNIGGKKFQFVSLSISPTCRYCNRSRARAPCSGAHADITKDYRARTVSKRN